MFYVKTPTGQVPLHVLEKCVLARLEYLKLLQEDKSHEFNGNFEYLLENSIYDRIGHFMLRLFASVSQDLCNPWIIRETLLFRTRLSHISSRQLYRLFKSITRQLRSLAKNELINETLIDVCNFFSRQCVFKHLISKNHIRECNIFRTTVRFELVPDLIKKRRLNLSAGYATVYCSTWKEVLISLFCTYLMREVECMKTTAEYIINNDDRLDYLYQKINCKEFEENRIPGQHKITKQNIDIEMKNFPLCMQHLHTQLRKVHRLSHYARFYYSLFLKDCGMPMEDAIDYWKKEYSKPHSCSSTCSHNWQSNERKFIYSIRHLYGLEGSRKNYKSPTCDMMCTNLVSAKYEGGCPFKNFDINMLKKLLHELLSEDQVTKIIKMLSLENPRIACTECLKMVNRGSDHYIHIKSPLQYYLTMTSQS